MNMFEFLKNPKINMKDPLKNEAIKKIKDEMEQHNNPQINIIGQILLDKLEEENTIAEKILNPEKNIMNCLKKINKEAYSKIKERGYNESGITCVFLSYQEGLEIIFEYFEIEKTKEVNV